MNHYADWIKTELKKSQTNLSSDSAINNKSEYESGEDIVSSLIQYSF